MTSKHSVALYEFLKDYQNIGGYSCKIEEFRRLMGIQPSQYSIFTMLRKRVLDTAVEEINDKTDIAVAYELERSGRKIIAIKLNVKAKEGQTLPQNRSAAIKEKLAEFGIRATKIESLIKKHDEQYLWANIAIVEEELRKGKINNVTAYILKAFQVDYRPQETPLDKKKKAEEQQKKEQEAKVQEEKALLDKQRTAHENRKKSRIESTLKSMEADTIEQLKTDFLQEIEENELFSKMLQSKGFDHPVIQIQRIKFLSSILLSAEESSFKDVQSLQNKGSKSGEMEESRKEQSSPPPNH
ncbi:MAG: replication initiation protein [Bacteroidota bacterium]